MMIRLLGNVEPSSEWGEREVRLALMQGPVSPASVVP